MQIDLHPKGLVVDGVVVVLSRREQALVSRLVAHAGVPQSRDTLLTEVWGYRAGTRTRTVESTMNRLRAKLEAAGAPLPIRTVRGQGWILDDPGPNRESTFVGRTAERRALDRWLAGTGRVLTVTGPPGIGKSALVAQAVGTTRIDGRDLPGPSAWLRVLDASPPGVLWVDDADAHVEMLAAMLPDRRIVVTSRRPLHHRAEEVVRLGPLTPEEAACLAQQWLDRWFPGAVRDIAQWVREADGNPLALELAIRAREAPGCDPGETLVEVVDRSVRLLGPELRTALARLAAVPVGVPDGVAVALAGSEQALVELRERSLVGWDVSGWQLPRIVRSGLAGPLPDVTDGVAPWMVDRASRAYGAGSAGWTAFLAELEPARPFVEWVARTSHDAQATWWATVALDDRAEQTVGLGGADRRPLLDRAIAFGGVSALLRRAREHRRHGESGPALADLVEAEARVDSAATRNRVRFVRSYFAYNAGDMPLAERLAEEVIAASELLGDHEREALANVVLSQIARWRGDHDTGLERACAATAVPVGGVLRLELTAYAAACEVDVGREAEGCAKLEEVHRTTTAVGHLTDACLAVCELGWTRAAIGRPGDALARMEEAIATLSATGTQQVRSAQLDYARALVAVGAHEAGLRELRNVTRHLLASGARVQAASGRAFGVAARVALGLSPVAGWMPPESLEGDPAVQELVRGFEGLSAGDVDRADAALARVSHPKARRAQALRRVLVALRARRATTTHLTQSASG